MHTRRIPFVVETRIAKVTQQLKAGLEIGKAGAILLSMELKSNYNRKDLERKLGIKTGSIRRYEREIDEDSTNNEEYLQY